MLSIRIVMKTKTSGFFILFTGHKDNDEPELMTLKFNKLFFCYRFKHTVNI